MHEVAMLGISSEANYLLAVLFVVQSCEEMGMQNHIIRTHVWCGHTDPCSLTDSVIFLLLSSFFFPLELDFSL